MSEINQICEKVIIIDKGKIIAIDTPKNLEEKIKNNVINLIVEDSKNWMCNIKEKIPEIIDIKLLSENGKEKSYELSIKENFDIRKKLFEILPKENINIIELKKVQSTLEEVFMDLIEEEGAK